MTDHNPITDSEVSGGEEEYAVRPVPKVPVGDSQNNGLAILSAAFIGSEGEETDNEGKHASPGDDICGRIPNDVTSATQQNLPPGEQTFSGSPRHASCTLLSHDPRAAPHYGLSTADLADLNIISQSAIGSW